MQKEIISLAEITQFQSAVEEFSPFEWYKHKLEQEPISYNEATNSWNVFRYDDVKRVLSDHEYFSSVRTRTTISVGADNEEGQHSSGRINLNSILRTPEKPQPAFGRFYAKKLETLGAAHP